MGESLVKLTAKQLRLFVTICDHAIKLRHTAGGKIKTAFKIAFLGESKIQDLLGEMAKHVGEEHLLISAHTFLSAHEAMTASRSNLTETKKIGDQMVQVQSQVKDLHAATAKESELHEQNRTDAAIKSALDFGREIAPVWRDRYREYAKARLPSTGNWIFDDPKFALWKKGQAGAKILAVTGGSGTGKSFLATSIIHHFIHRDSPAETTDTRASAAFYYLEGDEVKAMQNDSSIDAIAKSLIWQLSTVDGRYKKSAAAICREYQTGDVATMSHRLLFECPYFDEVNGIFFIVVDGLEGKLGGGMLRFLQDVSAGHHIRVLVTCDLECSEHLKVNGLILEPLHIEAKNKPDVQAFIESRMNEMPALNNFADSSVRDLRRAVSDGLIHVTGGDYIRVSFALGEISKQEYPEKILSIVNNAGRQRAEQISAEIEELDRSLTDAEISEVNEIVLWIQHCKGPLTVVRMADALRARDGNAEKSLLRLSDKFKAKYTLFTVTNRGEVRFRAPEVEEAIPQRRLDHHELEQRNSTVLSQGEAEMIKHFLRMVCPPTTLSKLNVDALLARKHQDKFSWICQDDPNTGESKLALTCLRVLTDGVNKQENGLSSYARASFDRHLAAVDLAFVDVGLKALVGQHLVKLFTHETSIDALLCNRESSRFTPVRIEVCHKLLLQSDTANTIIRWLGDSAVTSKIEDQETKKWLLDVIHDGDHGKLLAPAAKRMAFHLVRQPHKLPLIRGAFSFVLYYIRKVSVFRRMTGSDIS
jgi:GTPase SAR1 family protein